MINAYSSLVEYNENEWEDYLDRILLLDVFKDLLEFYKDRSTLKCAIQYIAYAYSIDSDKVIIGHDWQENKKKIYEFVCAKPVASLYEQLVHLQSEEVLKTVHRWLEFQNADVWKNLCSLKDLKVEMQLSCNSRILKANGEVDYSQKFLNAGYVKELSKMIKDLESELIQNNPNLKEAVKEINRKSPAKNSRSVGSYAI